MKKLLFLLLLVSSAAQAQELFVFTEPASNMPSKSLGIRVTNNLMKRNAGSGYDYQLLPELMWGVNKNLMIHADAFASNRFNKFAAEGFGFYGKYRFFTSDKMYSHFRMAAFGRVSYNQSAIAQEEIETFGNNSGYEAGLIATQLLHKVALSSSLSYEKALDNDKYKFPAQQSDEAINYSLSFGKLMLPKEYVDYNQTNVNLMVEFLGQALKDNGRSFLDVAPALQFIVNSQARIDIGYRKQLYSSMQRASKEGFLLRFEYLIFNVLK
ncbi:MAG: hypothetical protein ACTHJ5_12490 [Ilyomonas sp.]